MTDYVWKIALPTTAVGAAEATTVKVITIMRAAAKHTAKHKAINTVVAVRTRPSKEQELLNRPVALNLTD